MSARRVKTKNHPGVYFRIGADGKRKYEITYRDEHGKQRWERVPGDLDTATDHLAEIKRKLRGGEPVRPDERNFGELRAEWEAIYLPKVRASTANQYRGVLERYVGPNFDALNVRRIDSRRLALWITGLETRNLSAGTIRTAIIPLRRIFKYAVREGVISQNPFTVLGRDEMPRGEQRERRVLDKAELERLFKLADKRSRLPLQVLAFTGLRVSEFLALTWRDLDLAGGTINVRRQLDDHGNRVALKTPESARTVFLMSSLVRALKRHKLAALPAHSTPDAFVFTRANGKPMTRRGLTSSFARAVSKAGFGEPSPTLHSLRHGFGSMLIAEGSDIVFVSRQMGHANPSITMRIYAHVYGEREAARKMTADMDRLFGAALDA